MQSTWNFIPHGFRKNKNNYPNTLFEGKPEKIMLGTQNLETS
jgi:hypothetical protein